MTNKPSLELITQRELVAMGEKVISYLLEINKNGKLILWDHTFCEIIGINLPKGDSKIKIHFLENGI